MAQYPFFMLLLLLPLLLPLHFSYAANILAVLPSIWKSHYLFGQRLLQQLVVQHNHTVTIVSPHAQESNGVTPGIHEIRIDGLMNNWLEMGLSFSPEELRAKSIMERFTRLIYAGTANADLLLSDQQVRQLLRSQQNYDLLVIDLFLSDSLLGLSFYYNTPTIVLSPNGANTWLNQMLGNPQSSALDPSNFLPYSERMNVWQRSINTLMALFEKLTYNFFHMISQQSIYDKHFNSLCLLKNITMLPHHRELTKNLSLVLINSNPIVQYPRAYLPNMLEVAGAHLSKVPAALTMPRQLQSFIEGAEEGVVYMSLGADMQTADMAREKLDVMLDVFSYLKQMRFLIKWELQQFFTKLPTNVLISAWFPQEAILAHANVKVFISSCGLMSVMEAINGVTPILSIAVQPEQEVMAQRLLQQQVALHISYDNITFDAVLQGIEQLSRNESYAQNMQKLQQLFWSSYADPLTKSLHYINLVMQSAGGAGFLQSHANQLSFLRAELIDVLAIIAFGAFSILAVPFFIICAILRHYNTQCGNSDSSNSSSNYQFAWTATAMAEQQRRMSTTTNSSTTPTTNCSLSASISNEAFAIPSMTLRKQLQQTAAAAAEKLLVSQTHNQLKTLQEHSD